MKVTLAAAFAFAQAPRAFNRIHESSYNLEPRGNFRSGTALSIAGIIDSRATDVWAVPVSISIAATPRVELGAGLKTRWGDAGDHVPYLVFGAKWLAFGRTSFQADLLVPANSGAGKGFSLASHHRFGNFGILSSRLAARLGFMEAMVDNDAFMAMEAGYYPALALGRSLSLELGLIGSSQTDGFEDHLAMDLQPGITVGFARESSLQACVGLGLAGPMKEEMRAKLILNFGF